MMIRRKAAKQEGPAVDPWADKVLWACIARDGKIMVEAECNDKLVFRRAVQATADVIVAKEADRLSSGWESYTYKKPAISCVVQKSVRKCPPLQALKLQVHEYREESDDDDEKKEDDSDDTAGAEKVPFLDTSGRTVWSFCCVYNPTATAWNHPYAHVEADIKSFLKEMDRISADMRESSSWNSPFSCQKEFGDILSTAMVDVSYVGRRDRVNRSIAKAKKSMNDNISTMVNEQQEQTQRMQQLSTDLLEQSKVFQRDGKKLKEHQMWKHRKTTAILGGVATGTAVVVGVPLIAVL